MTNSVEKTSRNPAGGRRNGRHVLPIFRSTERRRSRTDRAVGYTTAPVLKTGWATGPVPLRGEASSGLQRRPPQDALVPDAAGQAVGVEALQQQLGRPARDAERVAEAGERDRRQ